MKKIIPILLLFTLTLNINAQNWDINILRDINGINNKGVQDFSKTVTNSVYVIPTVTTAGILAYGLIGKDDKAVEQGLTIGASLAANYVAVTVMKKLIDRERPYDKYPDQIIAYAHESSASFPSGHTSMAFDFATSLTLHYPKWYIIAPSYLWATSVGFARMNQGVHYPSDVLAGAVVGTGCAFATYYANKWIRGQWARKKKLNAVVNY